MTNLPPHFPFCRRIIRSLVERGVASRQMKVLALCGDAVEKELFRQLGFTDVTISNLDSRVTGDEYKPYKWIYQDAQALSIPDDSYDMVMICAGLHHCSSPHRALLEAYRVARRCVIALEARDGLLSRIGAKLGVVDEYEITSVMFNNLTCGGVNNTAIPNYIYRWTEREVIKTLASYAPYAPPRVHWFYEFNPPFLALKKRKTLKGLVLMYLAYPLLWLLTRVFKSQCNLFAFAAVKPDLSQNHFPWLNFEQGKVVLNRQWVTDRFKPLQE